MVLKTYKSVIHSYSYSFQIHLVYGKHCESVNLLVIEGMYKCHVGLSSKSTVMIFDITCICEILRRVSYEDIFVNLTFSTIQRSTKFSFLQFQLYLR